MSRVRASNAPPAAASFDPAREGALLLERCRALAEHAAATGVDEHEAFGERAESVAVRFEKGDMKLTQVDSGTSLGLRVFDRERLGFASTNQDGDEALERTARDAASLARINPPDPANRTLASQDPAPPLELVQPALAALELERAVDLGRRFVDVARARDPRISIDQAAVHYSRGTRAIVNDRGLALAESDAALSFSIFGMAIEGEDVGGFHYCGDCVRTLDGLEQALQAAADEFATTVLENLGAGAAESYRGPVLFAPDAFLEIFVAPLVSAASAIAVQRGRSALAEKLGQRIAASILTVRDDPRDATLRGASAFDREGTPARAYDVVRDGVLAGFLYNGYAANVAQRASSGHAGGGPRALPSVGPHALVVEPGAGGSSADLMERLGRGLYVQRFSGSVDTASGDFSGVAKSARWIEGGRPVRAVRETLLAGNAFELLARIVALSATPERVMGAALVPYALVDGISVTAG